MYRVRVLLDEDVGLSHVSIVPPREPLLFWQIPLLDLPHSPCPPRSLNSRLEVVTPHAVVGEDGRPKSSWRCPSLLKAIDLMLHLDGTSGGKIQECQAPGCPNYFRVGPRSRESMYCPPPPGKKQTHVPVEPHRGCTGNADAGALTPSGHHCRRNTLHYRANQRRKHGLDMRGSRLSAIRCNVSSAFLRVGRGCLHQHPYGYNCTNRLEARVRLPRKGSGGRAYPENPKGMTTNILAGDARGFRLPSGEPRPESKIPLDERTVRGRRQQISGSQGARATAREAASRP